MKIEKETQECKASSVLVEPWLTSEKFYQVCIFFCFVEDTAGLTRSIDLQIKEIKRTAVKKRSCINIYVCVVFMLTSMSMRSTLMYCQLSVPKAMANNATDTTAHIVAKDRVMAEQGIVGKEISYDKVNPTESYTNHTSQLLTGN